MKALIAIFVALLQVLLPALFKATEKTAEDSASQPELKKRLRAKVRQTWATVLLLLCMLLFSGCGARTIYVPEGEPVRLRETIRGAKVWVKDQNGNTVAGRVDLLEGWYCLALPDEDQGGQ